MLQKIFRPSYQKIFIEPIIAVIAKKISPNQVTLLGVFSGCMAAITLPLCDPIIPFSLLMLSAFFDSLDGSIARYLGVESETGERFDWTCDRVVVFSMITALYFVDPGERLWMLVSALSFAIVYYVVFVFCGKILFNIPARVFCYSRGIAGQVEIFVIFSAMILFPQYMTQLMMVVFFLMGVTFIQSARVMFLFSQGRSCVEIMN